MIFMTTSCWNAPNSKYHGLAAGLLNTILPLFALLSVIFSSCTKDPVNIGIDLLPDDDFIEIHSTDTISVRAYTMYDESSLSSDSTRMIAGGIYDEYFGTTHCDFVTQLRLMTAWPHYSFEIDSVILYFTPDEVAGDTAATHYIQLWETGTELTDTTDFYSSQDPDTITFLGEYLMPVLKADSTYAVKLDNSVGEYLLRDTTQFLPASNFYKNFFRGLYFGIRSDDNPVLITMYSARENFGIIIFYHDETDVGYSYSFVATERAVNYNRFTHDRSTAAPDKEILHINDFVTDTAVYLQAYHGVYTLLDLPSLESFRGMERFAVNKARIYAPVHLDGETYQESNMPGQIYLRYRNSEGKEFLVPDLVHSLSFMDGTYHTVDDRYVFNITTFVQNYLEGKIDTPSVELFLPLTAQQNVIFKANGNEPTITFDFAYTIY
jgi:hypothetical protein